METDKIPQDLLAIENNYERADTGKRLANYIIDIALFYALTFGVFFTIAVLSPSTFEGIDDDSTGFGLADRILTLCFYAVYMSVIEAVFKGKSLGKLITGTRAVNLDGSKISTSTAFARGFSRAVPFCVFSAFGTPCNPWQDRWTNTMVIDERKSDMHIPIQ